MREMPRTKSLDLLAIAMGIIAAGGGAAYYYLDGGPPAFVGLAAGSLVLAISAIKAAFATKAASSTASSYRNALEAVARGDSITQDINGDISELSAMIAERERQIVQSIQAIENGDHDAVRFSQKDGVLLCAIGRLASHLKARSRNTGLSVEIERSLNELAEAVSCPLTNGPAAEQVEAIFAATPAILDDVAAHIGRISANIKDAAVRVEFDGGNIESAAGTLIKNSEKQASDLESTSGSAASIARQAARLAELVDFTDASITEGDRFGRLLTSSVAEIAVAARSTRRESQESLKRTKRIGERTQELGRAVFDLEEIADRMNILALNSSLRNTADANRFVPEVKELADRITQLTARVSQLSQFLTTETRDTAGSMESVIREVILGSAIAEKAGAAAAGLDETASESRRSLTALSDAVRYQARITEELARSLSAVSETSEAVRGGSHALTDAMRSLNGSILGLTNALAVLKPRAGAVPVPADPTVRERFIN